MDEYIFSVIIPHKNTPDLLQRCLDSIPRRKDVQIIVVDDNSDEDKVDFSHFPCMEDEYVEVYLTKEGKGAGYARNIGMTHAKGKWLLFADADDFFTENAFEHFFASKDSPHEIIYFKVIRCFSDTRESVNEIYFDHHNSLVDAVIAGEQDAVENIRYKWHVPWARMINKKFVDRNNIRFDEIVVSDDVMFSLLTGYSALSVDAMDIVVYCTTIRKGSLENQSNANFLVTQFTVGLRYNVFLREHGLAKYQQIKGLYSLFVSLRYGFLFIKCIRLAFQYKMNLFTGINQWIPAYFSYQKRLKKRKNYIVKS